MGKIANIRRDIARARPCRLCNAPVFIVRVNYRVVPWPDEGGALDLVSMPTRMNMVLEQVPDDRGFYVINDEANSTNEGFVAYDPEQTLDAQHWGFTRYRGHDCPESKDKWERAHGNRTFLDGRVLHPGFDADDADVGSAVG
jgi:hypothetical protein